MVKQHSMMSAYKGKPRKESTVIRYWARQDDVLLAVTGDVQFGYGFDDAGYLALAIKGGEVIGREIVEDAWLPDRSEPTEDQVGAVQGYCEVECGYSSDCLWCRIH